MHPSCPPDALARSEAFDLAAALDTYEATCSQLVARWLDMNLYLEAGKSMARIREHGVSVPPLTVLALQLAIAHCELESMLWQKCSVGVPDEKVQEVRQRHAGAVQVLRLAVGKLLVPND